MMICCRAVVLVGILFSLEHIYGSILMIKNLERVKILSATQSASQPLRVHRHGSVRAESDLSVQSPLSFLQLCWQVLNT